MMNTAVANSGLSKLDIRNMGLITLGHSLTHWYPATFFMLLPIIGNEMGLSYSQIGFVMTCQYAAGALSNVPGGMLVDVWKEGPVDGPFAFLGGLSVFDDGL